MTAMESLRLELEAERRNRVLDNQYLINQRDRLLDINKQLMAALYALTTYSRNGEQLCFRTTNGVPMGMSKKQERIAQAALSAANAPQ